MLSVHMAALDLNADLGEGFDDDPLLEVVTSANVACGFHAGDAATMRRVAVRAAQLGVAVGAHVSYRDREGFGRRTLDVAPERLAADVAEQLEALAAWCEEAGTRVRYVKPHGALYNTAAADRAVADAIVAGLGGHGALPVLGLPGSALLAAAAEAGLPPVPEGFPDRGYTPEGTLVPRDQPGALVEDPDDVAAHAVALAGTGIASLCVHGDSPGAVEAARRTRAALTAAGFELRPFA
jgi:UPF0271 protein